MKKKYDPRSNKGNISTRVRKKWYKKLVHKNNRRHSKENAEFSNPEIKRTILWDLL